MNSKFDIPVKELTLAGKTVQYFDYPLSKVNVMARLALQPPPDWKPELDDRPLHERLPYALDDHYKIELRENFQPVQYKQNATALANYIRQSGDADDICTAKLLLVEQFRVLETRCVEDRGVVFVENRFPWPNRNLPTGWVSAIVNAFAILGNIKLLEIIPDPEIADITRRLANAYSLALAEGEASPGRWITYVDRESNVWFDEYPHPEGQATLVLNGHIFAVQALYKAGLHFSEERYLALANAGISTLRKTLPRFRSRGRRNRYSLRGFQRPDYLPKRTVKQQLELYSLTGDEYFRRWAMRFLNDMRREFDAADIDQLEHLETKLRSRAAKNRRKGRAVSLLASRVGLPLRAAIANWSGKWRARKDSNLRPPDS